MKFTALAATLMLAVAPASAAVKSCAELKTEIEAKIKAKNVKAYTLEVMASADVKDQAVVGSCEGGKKKIVYMKS